MMAGGEPSGAVCAATDVAPAAGRESWASRFGFIMVTAGFAIGLGNIWRFPYMTGMNGGGAFLLVYVVFAILIGVPLLTIEVGLGRRVQLTPIAGMAKATGSYKNPWNLIAWLGITAAALMNAYYVMLIGWVVGYFWMVSTGHFTGSSADQIQDAYATFTATPGPVLACTWGVLIAMTLVVRRGLRDGLERVSRVAMPVLFVLLVLLAIRSLTLPGAALGLAWYLTPDFSQIDGASMLAALGQAFYSIGIGMAAAFGLGSYLHREQSDVPGNAAIVVVCDTLVAVLAGLVIFPALFAFGLEPNSGPGLLFVTMTNLFAQMPAGQVFGSAFFFLLILAGVTSAMAIFEVMVSTLMEVTRLARGQATYLVAGVWAVLSTLVILFEGPWSEFGPWGPSLFVALDSVIGNYLLPVGGLLLVVYAVLCWGFANFRDDVNTGAGRVRVTAVWKPLVTAIIPIAVALLLLVGLGLIG